MNTHRFAVLALAMATAVSPYRADPCGMVPPLFVGDGPPITRIGIQRTYVFYSDGVESLVLRPGFEGRVDEFGMLIPFPSPPEIRKVADDVFEHVAAAVDPPEVVVDLRPQRWHGRREMLASKSALQGLGYVGEEADEVRVIRREAVGMYEVAVLDVGSAAALQVWMDDQDFRYPTGMDDVCQEYIDEGWCFVAVKAKVGAQGASTPRPGMREVDVNLPAGSNFDGYVQAMGFRFRTDELVVPMRLSAFNPGELRNIVYVLSDVPRRILNLPDEFVVRQVPGSRILANLTEPLPLRILGGELEDVPDWRRQSLPAERDPLPHNGIARELFASDLLAAQSGSLSHAYEELEKELLAIGEELGLRGSDLDALHREVLADERERMILQGLGRLHDMTLTVVDGEFPRPIIAAENLRFSAFAMPSDRNDRERYDARFEGPPPVLGGTADFHGSSSSPRSDALVRSALGTLGAALVAFAAVCLSRRRELRRVAALACGLSLCGLVLTGMKPVAGPPDEVVADELHPTPRCGLVVGCEVVAPSPADRAALLVQTLERSSDYPERGRAILELGRIGGEAGLVPLATLARQSSDALVRTWAAAALMQRVESAETLLAMSDLVEQSPALVRPYSAAWRVRSEHAEDGVGVAAALEAIARVPALQQEVLASFASAGTGPLLGILLESEYGGARRLAAGLLAGRASSGDAGVAAAVVRGLRYDDTAERLPWHGGPLFIPSVGWSTEGARALWRELIGWHLYCHRNEDADGKRVIHNALNSWGLANAAGYPMPRNELSSTRWLLTYGEVVGVEPLRELLDEFEVEGDQRLRALLVLLGAE